MNGMYFEYSFQIENASGVQHQATVITLSKLVTPQAMQQCLQFIYTGSLDKKYHDLQVRFTITLFLSLNVINFLFLCVL